MSTIKTFAAIILDKSGSMGHMKDFAINTFNEQIQTLKEESNDPKEITKKILKGKKGITGIETYLTLVSFNDNVKFHTFNKDVSTIDEFPADEYQPNGSTALFDAIGETINRFTDEIPELEEENAGALLIIVTDGQENASRNYKGEEGRKKLKSRIEELQETGKWTITFMGAEDVFETVVEGLGLAFANTITWDPTNPAIATSNATVGTRSYMNSRVVDEVTSVDNFYSSPVTAGPYVGTTDGSKRNETIISTPEVVNVTTAPTKKKKK